VLPRAVNRASRPKPGLVLALILAQVLSVRSAARHAVPTSPGGARGGGLATGNNKPLITYQRRRLRIKSTRPPAKDALIRRTSSRLAAKAPAVFVDMTSQAMHRKVLLNSLFGCSLSLKKVVSKRNILSHNGLPIGAKDLRMLTSAAGLDAPNPVQTAFV